MNLPTAMGVIIILGAIARLVYTQSKITTPSQTHYSQYYEPPND